jgi:hypothetical protein
MVQSFDKQFDPVINYNNFFLNTDSSWKSCERWSLFDTFGSEMHRYLQAPFCDAVVIGSADVRQHQVVTVFTVFLNHKITVMEKEAFHQVKILKLQRCGRLASDFLIFQRKFKVLDNFF